MTEKQLRDDLKQVLQTDGWNVWFARRMKFIKDQDILTIYDGIKAKGNKFIPIQFTTLSNKSSHIKKIKEYKSLYGLTHKGELWLWDNKKNKWLIEKV